MAHIRNRYITQLIKQACSLSPLIGILGHRQVGKTTVAEKLSRHYLTLDDEDLNKLANKKPTQFISTYQTYLQAIDECQYAPPLFRALKEHVRKNKNPGQYLLTGSVRFTSRKAIQESLTGRIVNFELLPLTISEMAHQPLSQTLEPFFSKNSVEKIIQIIQSKKNKLTSNSKEYQYYFEHGGLPGVCFIQNKKFRDLKIKEQLSTMLDRDIRQIYPTTLPQSQIFEFLSYIAFRQGQKHNYSDAKSETRIAVPTQKKLLYAFEAIFLIRRIKLEGSFKGEVFYLEDQAESFYLTQGELSEDNYFEQLVYRNLRAQFYYNLGMNFKEFSFETRGGVRIPYAIESNGFNLAIITITEELPNRSEKAAAASFLKTYNNSRVLFLHKKSLITKIDDKSISAPIYWFV